MLITFLKENLIIFNFAYRDFYRNIDRKWVMTKNQTSVPNLYI